MNVAHALRLMVAGLLASCHHDSNGGSSSAQVCHHIYDVYCVSSSKCSLPSDRARDLDDCEFTVDTLQYCDDVSTLGDGQGCLDALAGGQCIAQNGRLVFPYPAVCKEVLFKGGMP